MFILAANKEIGNYLSDKIRENYPNIRQFAKAFLEKRDEEASEESIRQQSNRFYQIVKGAKQLQITDLPYVCDMLDITCENILSAGKSPNYYDRRTNYSVAASKNPEIWKKYLDDEKNPIWSNDEYGKSILDYIVQFRNAELFDFLLENGLVLKSESYQRPIARNCDGEFNKIVAIIGHKKHPANGTIISYGCSDDLQCGLAALAVKSGNFELAKKLIARNIPLDSEITEFLHSEIVKADNADLFTWLTDEKTVNFKFADEDDFVYANLGDLIECALDSDACSPESLNLLIKGAEKYNEKTLERLKNCVNEAKECKDIFLPFIYDNNIVNIAHHTTIDGKNKTLGLLADPVFVYSDDLRIKKLNKLFGEIERISSAEINFTDL